MNETGGGFYIQGATFIISAGVDSEDSQISIRVGQQTSVGVAGYYAAGVDFSLWPGNVSFDWEFEGGFGGATPILTPTIAAGVLYDFFGDQTIVFTGVAPVGNDVVEWGVYATYDGNVAEELANKILNDQLETPEHQIGDMGFSSGVERTQAGLQLADEILISGLIDTHNYKIAA